MSTPPSNKLVKPNKLVLPSLILAALSASLAPFALISSAVQVYVFLVLPLGFGAALMAKIALNQIKRGAGTPLDRNLALVALFSRAPARVVSLWHANFSTLWFVTVIEWRPIGREAFF